MDTTKKYIDLEKIIKEGDSEFLKKLPVFIVKLIKRVIWQKELNEILARNESTIGVDFLFKMVEEFKINIEIEGLENLPENGKCFFAANHPLGVIDGLVLTTTVAKKYGNFKAIANDAFLFIPQLRPLVAAVSVFGRSSRQYIAALDEVYQSEIPITHFPAGLVSRRFEGKVQDSAWQKSFISKSIASKRDIVPFYFYNKNSRLFYSIYTVRKFLGLKLNLELALLPHEAFLKRNKTIKVKIGKPISYQTFDKSLSHNEWAQNVRNQVYALGEN
ncbi:MAG: 1-acyl-sn-glycerol-3-phosphate acyltransferase [Bacteroidales bacterium]|nr:1-acyl-sn-glycerol-3-phosphate acyltransferase [Bacteroidales bacterium]